MKRTALLTRTPLERKTPMKRTWMKKKPARRIAREKALRPRLAFAASQPCAARHLGPCRGPVQVAHVGKGGMGLKHGTPMQTLPLCGPEIGTDGDGHHQQFDQSKGDFDGWSRQKKTRWVSRSLAVLNGAFLRSLSLTEAGAGELERAVGRVGT